MYDITSSERAPDIHNGGLDPRLRGDDTTGDGTTKVVSFDWKIKIRYWIRLVL